VATLEIDGLELVVRLGTLEKVEAVHDDVRVALKCVTSVEVLEHPIKEIHGLRIGTGIPGSVAIGTFTSRAETIFAIIHHHTPSAVQVRLAEAPFDRIIIGCPDPASVVTSLRGAL